MLNWYTQAFLHNTPFDNSKTVTLILGHYRTKYKHALNSLNKINLNSLKDCKLYLTPYKKHLINSTIDEGKVIVCVYKLGSLQVKAFVVTIAFVMSVLQLYTEVKAIDYMLVARLPSVQE